MKIDISILDPASISDLYALMEVFEDVFETESGQKPSSDHLIKLLNQEGFITIVAKIEGRVVGGLTLYVLDQYISEKPLAYLYDFAVLTQFQRKGIGSRLIDFTKSYCRKQGFEELYVQVDKVDLFAIEFYRSTNPSSEDRVIQFSYHLNQNETSG